MASLSYAAALALKSEDAYAPLLSMETLPLLLLSGVLLPMSLAPPWLDALSRANPLRYVVDAVRAAFQGRYATGEFGFGLAVAVVLAAAAVSLGVRTFRRESA